MRAPDSVRKYISMEEHTMTKAELIAAIVERAETSKKDTEAAINAAMDIIKETVAGGSDVQLMGFGTFTMAERGHGTVYH